MLEFLEGDFGIKVIEFFQTGWLAEAFWYILIPFHYLGSEMGYLLVLPLIYWSFNKKLGKRLFVFVMLGTVFTNIFKFWWQRPRPFHVSPEKIKHIEMTPQFGLPSGHSIFGAIFGATLYHFFQKQGIKILCILFILFMGISRMVHGMHFLQDVLLGWTIGILLVFGLLKLEKPILKLTNSFSLTTNILIIIAITLLFYFFTLVFNNGYEIRKELLSPFGAIAGGAIGFLIEGLKIQFKDTKLIKTKLLRGLIGLVAMFIVYFLLNFAFYGIVGEKESAAVLILYTIRYMLLGFWITAGIPYLFLKFKLD